MPRIKPVSHFRVLINFVDVRLLVLLEQEEIAKLQEFLAVSLVQHFHRLQIATEVRRQMRSRDVLLVELLVVHVR